MGLFGGGAVHFKANLVLLHYEPNDAAVFGKMRYVADREQSLMLGGGENRPQAALFRRSNEQDAARGQILNRGKSFYGNFFPVNAFTFHGSVENCAERIFPQNTNRQRLRASDAVCLPSHKFSEVIKVSGFYL